MPAVPDRARGVRAAPTFVISNAHAVEGAQPAEFWLSVIDELAGGGGA